MQKIKTILIISLLFLTLPQTFAVAGDWEVHGHSSPIGDVIENIVGFLQNITSCFYQ